MNNMNVLELFASLKLNKDDYEQGLKDASSKASDFGSKLSKGLGTVSKLVTGAVTTATVAAGALVKQSVSAYANYEQLVGGVQTLFGEISKTGDASAKVIENAANAYKTAGLSANEYMEMATSFAASLMSSLENDGQKAADVADMAVQDMADNANKMGTSMQSIQNAYQGFAKQNYTMLDNLKLGYGGTKSEMERLLADAEKITGTKYDIQNLNDVYQAIHVIQGELGITGTTAKEAGTTISGSVASMKSAWENLLTSLSDPNADIGAKIDDLMTTIFGDGSETNLGVLGNVLPVVEKAITSLGNAVEVALPKILDRIPELLNTVLPELLASGKNMILTLVKGIKDNAKNVVALVKDIIMTLIDAIIDVAPELIEIGAIILLELVQGISESLPDLIPKIVDAILLIVETLLDNIDLLIEAGAQLIVGLTVGIIDALPQLVEKIPEIIVSLVDALINAFPMFIQAFSDLFTKSSTEITPSAQKLLSDIWNSIISFIDNVVSGIENFFNNIKTGVSSFIDEVEFTWNHLPEIIANALGYAIYSLIQWVEDMKAKIPEIKDNIINSITTWWEELPAKLETIWNNIITGITTWITNIWNKVVEEVPKIKDKVIEFFSELPTKLAEIGKNIAQGFINGIVDNFNALKDKVSSTVDSFVEGIRGKLGVHSPSKVFEQIGNFLVQGLEQGWTNEIGDARKNIESDLDFSAKSAMFETEIAEPTGNRISDFTDSILENITNAITELQNVVSSNQGDIIIPVYVGNEQIDTILVNASNRLTYRSGGRVNV